MLATHDMHHSTHCRRRRRRRDHHHHYHYTALTPPPTHHTLTTSRRHLQRLRCSPRPHTSHCDHGCVRFATNRSWQAARWLGPGRYSTVRISCSSTASHRPNQNTYTPQPDFDAAKAEVARLRSAIDAANAGAKTIAAVAAREVYDSRGNPTVEVELTMNDGSVHAAMVGWAFIGYAGEGRSHTHTDCRNRCRVARAREFTKP